MIEKLGKTLGSLLSDKSSSELSLKLNSNNKSPNSEEVWFRPDETSSEVQYNHNARSLYLRYPCEPAYPCVKQDY